MKIDWKKTSRTCSIIALFLMYGIVDRTASQKVRSWMGTSRYNMMDQGPAVRTAFNGFKFCYDKLLVFGGNGGSIITSVTYNDLYQYDPSTGFWSNLTSAAVEGSLPQSRNYHGCTCVSSRFYVFGGINSLGRALKSERTRSEIMFRVRTLNCRSFALYLHFTLFVFWRISCRVRVDSMNDISTFLCPRCMTKLLFCPRIM